MKVLPNYVGMMGLKIKLTLEPWIGPGEALLLQLWGPMNIRNNCFPDRKDSFFVKYLTLQV